MESPGYSGVRGDAMIGVALGSPSLAQPPPPATCIQSGEYPGMWNSVDEGTEPIILRHKPSKWKKIGGLFKAKNGLTPPPKTPFYQVRVSDHPLHPSPDEVAPPEHLFQPRYARHGGEPPWASGYSKGHAHREIWPQVEDDANYVPPTPPKSAKPKLAKEGHKHIGRSKSKKRSKDEEPAENVEPMLNIDIPDVQMERYSVMFGSLLGKGQPSTLLARRSKALDKLKTPGEEVRFARYIGLLI
jgi:hypothetical protein